MKRFLKVMIIVLSVSFLIGCGKQEDTRIDDKYRTYYEVFVRSFYDGNGDGIGDFQGLTSKLDYINETGFNGIWLMPIMPSPTYHKYDVVDYYDIDPEYGTLEDFKVFLEEANKRGIRVIIDLVFNHTSSEHPWFVEASDYLLSLEDDELPDASVCPYINYYHFTKEGPKTNYSRLGESAWYYESVFWSGMPDLNLNNNQVRKEIEDISDYWLDMGVSGFRLDAVKEYETGHTEKSIDILTWYVDYIKARDPQIYLVAEVWDSIEVVAAYYESGIDSIFNYPFGNSDGQIVKTLRNADDEKSGISYAKALERIDEIYRKNNEDLIDAPFLSNHDTGRIAGFLAPDEEKIKLAGALNLLMSGSVFVYYGEEIGMKGAGKDENKRAPMYFEEGEFEGKTIAPPNMDYVKQKYEPLNKQMEDNNSIYHYYKKIIEWRNKYPEIARGSQKAIEMENGNLIVIHKKYEEEECIIIINNSENSTSVTLNDELFYKLKLVEAIPNNQNLEKDILTLSGYGIVILK